MDALAIGVIAFSVIVMIAGMIFAHYANKASEKMQKEEAINKKTKQEETRKQKYKSK